MPHVTSGTSGAGSSTNGLDCQCYHQQQVLRHRRASEVVEKPISFKTYCESTSLHGWQYIYRSKSEWRLFWGGMVLSSVIVAFFFVFKQASEFTKATVVTTVDTTTAPLSDVYFPSVTICNINQVRIFLLSLFLCCVSN